MTLPFLVPEVLSPAREARTEERRVGCVSYPLRIAAPYKLKGSGVRGKSRSFRVASPSSQGKSPWEYVLRSRSIQCESNKKNKKWLVWLQGRWGTCSSGPDMRWPR